MQSDEMTCFPDQNEPSAIDAASLLRLITGLGGHGESSSSASSPPRSSEPAAAVSSQPVRSLEQRTSGSEPSDLSIPPLPTRLDLDDEMREAFLADATELFERIENLVVGLSSHSDQRGAIDELAGVSIP